MSIHNPKEDVWVSRLIQQDGCWECDYINKMINVLNEHPDSYFLDIGGNIGMWTFAAVAAKKETFTIEPTPINYSRICETVNKNLFNDKVHLWTMAATETPAVFGLKVPDDNKGGTTVIETTVNSTDDNTIVRGFPIDSLNLPTNRPVAIKMDVEGHELQALLGAKKYLQEANIVYTMIEITGKNIEKNEESWSELFDIFSSKGLVPFKIEDAVRATELDPKNLNEWKALRFDVVWNRK